jgi:pilus assembly protein CpaB
VEENGQQPTAAPAVDTDTVDIVVTTQRVRRGETLTEGLVQVVPIPREDYTEGVFFNSVEEVVGGRAKSDLEPHTPLTNALIVPVGTIGSIPAFDIPKGMVAISVPVSKLSSVSYGLQKGDHVNVIVSLMLVDLDTTFQTKLPNRTGIVIAPGPIDENQTYVTAVLQSPTEYNVDGTTSYSYLGRIELDPTMNNPVYVLPAEEQRPRLVSQTLIQDAVVLQMGYFPLEGEAEAPADEAAAEQAQAEEQTPAEEEAAAPPPAPEVVTLIVSPQDALTLNYLMLANAKLNLVMRSAGDDQRVDTEAVTLQFILDQHRIPNPAKLPYGLEPRLDTSPEHIQPFPDPGVSATPPPTE